MWNTTRVLDLSATETLEMLCEAFGKYSLNQTRGF
jgi:hypothetical protein